MRRLEIDLENSKNPLKSAPKPGFTRTNSFKSSSEIAKTEPNNEPQTKTEKLMDIAQVAGLPSFIVNKIETGDLTANTKNKPFQSPLIARSKNPLLSQQELKSISLKRRSDITVSYYNNPQKSLIDEDEDISLLSNQDIEAICINNSMGSKRSKLSD